ncbi:hypothetical protein L1887_40670 [Cichorium endivia]|nr:hypothetical protein L1887_40670 [Cichorium endivia]
MLKDRELEELSKGGFRYVVISSQHTNMNHTEEEEDETEHEEDDDVAAPERDCVSPVRDNKEVAHETSEKYEDYNVEEFNLACPYFPNSDVSHDGTFFNGVTTPVHGREITTESKDVEFHEAAIEDDAHNDVVFSTPFTQVLNEEDFDIIEKAALAACSKNSKQQSLNPDHRGLHLKIQTGNAVPVTVVAPRRTKRHVQPTEKFRSLYFKKGSLIQTKFLHQMRRGFQVGFLQAWTTNGFLPGD